MGWTTADMPAQTGRVAVVTGAARDEEAARRLWEVSERLTGATYL